MKDGTKGEVAQDIYYVDDSIAHDAGSLITKKQLDDKIRLYVVKHAPLTWDADNEQWETKGGQTILKEMGREIKR